MSLRQTAEASILPTHLTPLQELIKPLNRHSELLEKLLLTVKPAKNKVIEKISMINFLNMKKRQRNLKNENDEDFENNNNNFEDIPIPEKKLKESFPTNVDNKQIALLKAEAKDAF